MNWLARGLLVFALLVTAVPLALPVTAMDASMQMPGCDQCPADDIDETVCLTGCFAGLVAIMSPAVRVSTPQRARTEAAATANPASHARLPEPRPPKALTGMLSIA